MSELCLICNKEFRGLGYHIRYGHKPKPHKRKYNKNVSKSILQTRLNWYNQINRFNQYFRDNWFFNKPTWKNYSLVKINKIPNKQFANNWHGIGD